MKVFFPLEEQMDSSLLTQRRRHAATAASPKRRASDLTASMTFAAQRAGAGPFIYKGAQVPPPPSAPKTSPTADVFQTILFSTMDAMFTHVSALNMGPTKTSRHMYMWAMSVAAAYNWVTNTTPYTTPATDGWTWTTTHRLSNGGDVGVWMTQALTEIMPALIPGYNTAQLAAQEKALYGWTQFEQTTQINYVRTEGQFESWKTAWQTWFQARTADGSVAASVAPTSAQLPNGAISLDPAVRQTITAYPNPKMWTPLRIGGAVRNYYSRLWETVTSVGLTADDDAAAKAAAAPYFPGREDQRIAELEDVLAQTASLGIPGTTSDNHKIQAEFWAGGPYTISPPGMFMWLFKQYFVANNVYDRATCVYAALDLAIQLFEIGRVVWGLKLQYQQARPIQDIRRLYATATVGSWRTTAGPSGTLLPAADVSGALWTPYQVVNFVTPPFPDFVSGHSSFSQIFALVMTDWFGPTIPATAPTLMTNLNKFSGMFPATDTQPFGTFVVGAGRSEIQAGLVPAAPVTITFRTWEEVAASAGISRQWGGIHAHSAHVGGQAAARAVHAALRRKSVATAKRPTTF
jgi:membrane-associated phospholipid phosphatase